MSLTHTLKPLNLSGSLEPARSHLVPSDMSGVLTHSRRGRPGPSPLIHPDQPNTPHDEKLIEQTRKWVAQTFFGTMLKQMRNSPFKSPLFEGGRGGQAFGELYDQRLIDHMSHGVGNKLVMAIARRIVKKETDKAGAAYARHSTLAHQAASPSGHHAGANPDGKGGARQSPQKRHVPAPSGNPFQNVRIHVAPGL